MALAKTYVQSISGGGTKELLTDFNIYTGNVPFNTDYKAKQLPKNSWFDEDGDDEYVPDTLKLEAYEMSFEVGYKGAFQTAVSAGETLVNWFLNAGEFSMYCDYNQVGRTHVRFVSMSKPTVMVSNEDEGDIYKWNITLKVNDPLTNWMPIEAEWETQNVFTDDTSMTFGINGGTKTTAVYADLENSRTGEAKMISPSKNDFTVSNASPFTVTKGEGSITVTATKNTGANARTATITITYDGKTCTLPVSQACETSKSYYGWMLNAATDIGDVAVKGELTSGTAWEVTTNARVAMVLVPKSKSVSSWKNVDSGETYGNSDWTKKDVTYNSKEYVLYQIDFKANILGNKYQVTL